MRGNMKKIAHVLGSSRLTADVITVLRLTERLCGRFSFDIIMPNDAEYAELFLGKGRRVVGFDNPSEVSISAISRFARYFSLNPPDIVHTHVSLAARVGARLAGIKKSISTRSLSDGCHRARRWGAPVYNFFTAATVCHSSSIYTELVSEGVSPKKIITYLPRAEKRREGDEERRRGDEILLVCPLPIAEGFGQKTLIHAFARLKNRLNTRLVFLGGGSEIRECRLLASRLGVGERVEFMSDIMSTNIYKNRERIMLFTHEESWELCNNLFDEGEFSMIASNLPQNRELLDGVCLFYNSGDAFSLERAIERWCISDKKRPCASAGSGLSFEGLCDFYAELYSAF